MSWRRRLVYRVRAWSEEPDPADAELLALAPAGLFVLAICNVRHCLRCLFRRWDTRQVARQRRRPPVVRGVVVAPPEATEKAWQGVSCVLAGRRHWWTRVRRGYLLASLRVHRLDARGMVTVPPGLVAVRGRLGRDAKRGDVMHRFAAGDQVEIVASRLAAGETGGPYRGAALAVVCGGAELRVSGAGRSTCGS